MLKLVWYTFSRYWYYYDYFITDIQYTPMVSLQLGVRVGTMDMGVLCVCAMPNTATTLPCPPFLRLDQRSWSPQTRLVCDGTPRRPYSGPPVTQIWMVSCGWRYCRSVFFFLVPSHVWKCCITFLFLDTIYYLCLDE